MYSVKLTASAKRELKNISKLNREAVSAMIEELKTDPLLGKPLGRELTGMFSFKVGVYRIVYRVKPKDKQVVVLRVGHRSKVYQ